MPAGDPEGLGSHREVIALRETLEWRFQNRVEISRCERLGSGRARAVKAVRKKARVVSIRCVLLTEVVVSKVKGRVGFRGRMQMG